METYTNTQRITPVRPKKSAMMSGNKALSRNDVAKDQTASINPHWAPNASDTHAMLPRWSCERFTFRVEKEGRWRRAIETRIPESVTVLPALKAAVASRDRDEAT